MAAIAEVERFCLWTLVTERNLRMPDWLDQVARMNWVRRNCRGLEISEVGDLSEFLILDIGC